jgi:hypothetical protein
MMVMPRKYKSDARKMKFLARAWYSGFWPSDTERNRVIR